MNKGQTTLFVVFGIVLLVTAGLLLVLLSEEEEFSEIDTSDAEVMIESCLRNSALDGLRLMGRQGNRINIPNILEKDDTSLWIYRYGNVMPIFNSTVDEYERFIETQFLRCIDFSILGYNVDAGEVSSEAEFSAEEVIIRMDYPVNISKGGEIKQLKSFQQTLNVRYRRMFERAKNIVEAHYLPFFNYENALALVDQRDFNISYEILDENNLVFIIRDEQFLEGQEFEMKFATNLGRSKLKRTAEVDTNFFWPFVLYSPDRMAQLTLFKGMSTNAEKLTVYQEYSNTALSEVMTERTSVNFDEVDSKNEDLKWNLDYPIYSFGPDGTKFYGRGGFAPLTIAWDDFKNPNSGPMGILYRGERTDYEWRPIGGDVNYNRSFIATYIDGFSDYTALDCNKQSCKSKTVVHKNKPDNDFWCAIGAQAMSYFSSMGLATTSNEFDFGFGILDFNYLLSAGEPTMAGSVSGQALQGLTNYFILDTLGYMDYEEKYPNSISFVPTCDQIVEVSCVAGPDVVEGHCVFKGATIVPGVSIERTVNGGEEYFVWAFASVCTKNDYSCNSCEMYATVNYK